MNLEQFGKACKETERLLVERVGERVAEPMRDPDLPTHPHHLRWMIGQAVVFYTEKPEKANRWLGYVQGVMAALKLAGLDDLKRANMPDGTMFDPDRV